MKNNVKSYFLSGVFYALYLFCFLLTEFAVNVRSAELLGADSVNYIYSAGIFCTSLGYLSLHFSGKIIRGSFQRELLLALACCIYLAGALTMHFTSVKSLFTAASLISLFSFGSIGAYVHYSLSAALKSSKASGRIFGLSAAAATLLQFVMQNLLVTDAAFIISIVISVGILLIFIFRPIFAEPLQTDFRREENNKRLRSDLVLLIAVVFMMSLVVGLNDGIITALHAKGKVNTASYSRLFYALGLILAGFIADCKKRKYMALATVCTMLFSTVAIFFLSNPAMYELNSMLMYFYSGFYVIFLSLSFVDLAPKTKAPDLWAGMGRIVRGAAIALSALPSVWLFNSHGDMPVLLLSCALSAAVLLLLALSGRLFVNKADETKKDAPAPLLSEEEKLRNFSQKYSLTPRESEVVAHIVSDTKSIQETAEEMYLSRRTLQRYLTSVYKKTNTKSRIMLIHLYLEGS